jgi:precorrin-3B C17-methyltransferase
MVTPRGYTNKYTWDGAALPGQTPGRSLVLSDESGTAEEV